MNMTLRTLSLSLPLQVGHIKRLQHGIKDIQQGRLPPRLLQCVTASFPASSTSSSAAMASGPSALITTTAGNATAVTTVTTSTSATAAMATLAAASSVSPAKFKCAAFR